MSAGQKLLAAFGPIFKRDRCEEHLMIRCDCGIVDAAQNLGQKRIGKCPFGRLALDIGQDARLTGDKALS